MINNVKAYHPLQQNIATINNQNDFRINNSFNSGSQDQLCLSRNVIAFKGAREKQKFQALPEAEKNKIAKLFEYFYEYNKELQLTAIGRKPTTLLCLGEPEYKIIRKYKDLFESDHIKILVPNKPYPGKRAYDIYVFNTPKLQETIDKNLDLFRSSGFSNKDATVDEITQKIVGPKSPFLNDSTVTHEIRGTVLGYPRMDTVLFDISDSLFKALDAIEKKKDCPNHKKVIEKLIETIRPDLTLKYKEGSVLIAKKTDIVPKNGLPIPEGSKNCSYYPFVTWDSQQKECKDINNDIEKGVREAQKRFTDPMKLLNYLLSKKSTHNK